jgi:hypothetical protein
MASEVIRYRGCFSGLLRRFAPRNDGCLAIRIRGLLLALRPFIRKSGLIPRGLPRLKQIHAYKDLVVNQTVL